MDRIIIYFILSCWIPCYIAVNSCPCSDKSLCEPIKNQPRNEVFIFSVSPSNWQKYDWTKVTTIAEVNYHSPELLCHAHSQGARVVSLANFQPTEQLPNKTARAEWIAKEIQYVRQNYLDGINVDFESPIHADQKAYLRGLTSLMQELSQALKKEFKYSQITFDVPFRPTTTRNYDYSGIARACDFVFNMAYDMLWNVTDNLAHPNCDVTGIQYGLEEFFKMGISPDKIVLGLPWYGYNYSCVKYEEQSSTCYIKSVPFRGVQCSDAAGNQLSYSEIVEKLLPQSTTGRLWDAKAESPYFTYKCAGSSQLCQIWYDDPKSLSLKYNFAKMNKLRGVGMWQADAIDYSDTKQGQLQRQAMWGALP